MAQVRQGKRVIIVRDRWPIDGRHPNAWQGEYKMVLRIGTWAVRLRYFFADRTNDPEGVDTACLFNVSPRWWRHFHLYGYRMAFRRLMVHLTVGHVEVSLIPLTSYAWAWTL